MGGLLCVCGGGGKGFVCCPPPKLWGEGPGPLGSPSSYAYKNYFLLKRLIYDLATSFNSIDMFRRPNTTDLKSCHVYSQRIIQLSRLPTNAVFGLHRY